MEIYKQAAEEAKSKGDDRKARMHQRIMKVHTVLNTDTLDYFHYWREKKSKEPLISLCPSSHIPESIC